jgi:hypothetical protein
MFTSEINETHRPLLRIKEGLEKETRVAELPDFHLNHCVLPRKEWKQAVAYSVNSTDENLASEPLSLNEHVSPDNSHPSWQFFSTADQELQYLSDRTGHQPSGHMVADHSSGMGGLGTHPVGGGFGHCGHAEYIAHTVLGTMGGSMG